MRIFGCLLLLALALGCERRTLTEADCALIKDRLENAWNRDAVAAQRLANAEGYLRFIRDEGDRIGDAWMQQCGQMVGRPVSAASLDCLTKVQTIDDVYECAPQ